MAAAVHTSRSPANYLELPAFSSTGELHKHLQLLTDIAYATSKGYIKIFFILRRKESHYNILKKPTALRQHADETRQTAAVRDSLNSLIENLQGMCVTGVLTSVRASNLCNSMSSKAVKSELGSHFRADHPLFFILISLDCHSMGQREFHCSPQTNIFSISDQVKMTSSQGLCILPIAYVERLLLNLSQPPTLQLITSRL